MLHEVILALLGHPGAIVQEEHAGPTSYPVSDSGRRCRFRVPDSITFLTPTEREAINRVVDIGSVYRDLRIFVRPIDGAKAGQENGGLYLRALKLGVREVLDEYAERVAAVERDVMADPTLTLARVYAGVREFQSVLPAVAEACTSVAGDGSGGSGALKGPQLLEELHERSHFGAPDVRRRLCRLVWHCCQVLIHQCASWLLHGLLVDPYQEFFVQKNVDPISTASTTGSAASAGFDDPGNEIDRWSALDDSVEDGAVDGTVDGRAEEEWNSSYTVRLRLVPTAFVPHGLAQKMLFVGKVVRVLRQANPYPTSISQSRPTPVGPPSAAAWARESCSSGGTGEIDIRGGDNDNDNGMGVIEAEVLELTQRWSELRDRESFHLLALERAVHEAHALVDRRLYRLLVNVSGLERHLSSLKGLFLMGHGSLFHAFFDKAREAMRVKAGQRAVLDLNTWLAAAAEDHEHSHGQDDDHDPDTTPSSTSLVNALNRARLDLDPPGFSCKAFQDLTKQGFCVTGAATFSSKKSSMCLCPGVPGHTPQNQNQNPSTSRGSTASTSSAPSTSESASRAPRTPRTPSATSRSGRRPGAPPPSGSVWYTSDREVPRGFRTSVAFRCDRPKKPSLNTNDNTGEGNTTTAAAQGGFGSEGGATTGSLSFLVHQHRSALIKSGGQEDGEEGGASAGADMEVEVPNSLSVRLEPDGEGGGQVSIRWNPHRSPSTSASASLSQPDVGGASSVDTGNIQSGASLDDTGGPDPRTSRGQQQHQHQAVRLLGRATLPRSCGLSLDQVNYLMVDYSVGRPRTTPGTTRKRAGGSSSSTGRGDVDEARVQGGAELMVFVNDPGRSGSPVLSVKLDMWKLIELGGGRAFVGVSAAGPWRTTLRQWDFHLGGASAPGLGKAHTTLGPLGGVGSGPRVEEMVDAMDSWSGLCLHYRLEWPLHLVLTRETMQTYNRLFRLLATVKRASLELERVWPTLMQTRYRGSADKEKALLGPLWMLRARMAFFVSNLAFYLQVDVVEAAYSLLQKKLGAVRDFVSLQRAHQEFLSTLRAKFYIDNLEISQGLGRALRHVLRFCCLFALHGDIKEILPSEVTALHDSFQDEMKLLIPVLEKLAKELMMRLDYNGHFSAEAV